jgi:hypothetical protein
MLTGAPLRVLKRTLVLRAVYCLTLLPLAAFLGLGAWSSLAQRKPEPVTAAVFGGITAAILVLFVLLFLRELRLEVRLHRDGLVLAAGGRTRELRWEEIEQVWFRAIRVGAGGIIGGALGGAIVGAIGAAVDDARGRGQPLNQANTSITARLVGGGRSITLTSNFREVVAAIEEVLGQVNPRLVRDCLRRVQAGEEVAFGKVVLSWHGVRFGSSAPVGFGEVERFEFKAGKLKLKKRGAWLSRGILIHRIPNVMVLLQAFEELQGRGGSGAGVVGDLASSQYV